MEINAFDSAIEQALSVLRNGGVLLYPSDIYWALGCAANCEAAINRINTIVQKPAVQSPILLVADERSILNYVAAPDLEAFSFMQEQEQPTTMIFGQGINLPDVLLASDGSVAFRIVHDPFCRHLIRRLRVPLIATSANFSGAPIPKRFAEIDVAIGQSADHVAAWRQNEDYSPQLSQIVKWVNGSPVFIRNDV